MKNEFNNVENKMVDLLVNMGMTPVRASVVVCLSRDRDCVCTSSIVEKETGYMQSMVSEALGDLVKRHIIVRSEFFDSKTRRYKNAYNLVPVVSFMVRSVKDRIFRYNIDVPKKEEVKKYKFNF